MGNLGLEPSQPTSSSVAYILLPPPEIGWGHGEFGTGAVAAYLLLCSLHLPPPFVPVPGAACSYAGSSRRRCGAHPLLLAAAYSRWWPRSSVLHGGEEVQCGVGEEAHHGGGPVSRRAAEEDDELLRRWGPPPGR
jgi:hypothetical protein